MPSLKSLSPSFLPLLVLFSPLCLGRVNAHPTEHSCSCMSPGQQRCGDASLNLCCSKEYDCVYLKPFYHVCYNSKTGDWIKADGSHGQMSLSIPKYSTAAEPTATHWHTDGELKIRSPVDEGNVLHDGHDQEHDTSLHEHQSNTSRVPPCTCHGYITVTRSIEHPLETQHASKTPGIPVDIPEETMHPHPTETVHETKTPSGIAPGETHPHSSMDVPHLTKPEGPEHQTSEAPHPTSGGGHQPIIPPPFYTSKDVHVPDGKPTSHPAIPSSEPVVTDELPLPTSSHVPPEHGSTADEHFTTVTIDSTIYTFTKPKATSVSTQSGEMSTSSKSATPNPTTSRPLNVTSTPDPVGDGAGMTMVPAASLVFCVVMAAAFLLA